MSHTCCTLFTVFLSIKALSSSGCMNANKSISGLQCLISQKTCNADFVLKQKFNHLCQISSVIIYLFILFYPPGTKQSSTGLYWCQNGSEIRRSFSFSLMQNSSCVHSAAKRTKKPSHTTPGAATHSRSRRPLCSLTSVWLFAVWRAEPHSFDWQAQFYTRIKLSFTAQPLF